MGNLFCPCCYSNSIEGSGSTSRGNHRENNNWGGGQLGGENRDGDAREMRLQAAERRQGNTQNLRKDTTKATKNTTTTTITKQHDIAMTHTSDDAETGTGGDAASRAAAAAEARQRDPSLSIEKDQELKLQRTKNDLIGKIEACYRNVGMEPPFGLSACSVEALKKQLDYARNLSKTK